MKKVVAALVALGGVGGAISVFMTASSRATGCLLAEDSVVGQAVERGGCLAGTDWVIVAAILLLSFTYAALIRDWRSGPPSWAIDLNAFAAGAIAFFVAMGGAGFVLIVGGAQILFNWDLMNESSAVLSDRENWLWVLYAFGSMFAAFAAGVWAAGTIGGGVDRALRKGHGSTLSGALVGASAAVSASVGVGVAISLAAAAFFVAALYAAIWAMSVVVGALVFGGLVTAVKD